MELFITIAAILWFAVMTCYANYQAFLALKSGYTVQPKLIPTLLDLLSIAWLTSQVVKLFL